MNAISIMCMTAQIQTNHFNKFPISVATYEQDSDISNDS